jgi:arginine-tRNA-protein transferase
LAFLSLGKYSALREIQWVQEEHKLCPSLSYYYLGFYIHTCPKMRYKAAYAPSELLCPSKYIWVPYEQTRAALARSQYLCLSDVLTQNGSTTERSAEELQEAENMEESSENDIEEMSIDTLIVDAEVDDLPSNGEVPSDTENGPPSPHSGEEDETMEKFKAHSESLGKIILLVNNKCLTFKRLEEMRVVKPEYMAVLAEDLISYMLAVGPELASRMVFVPR